MVLYDGKCGHGLCNRVDLTILYRRITGSTVQTPVSVWDCFGNSDHSDRMYQICGNHELLCFQIREEGAAGSHLSEASAAGVFLPLRGSDCGGGSACRRRRGAAGDILWKLSATVFLFSSGTAYFICRGGASSDEGRCDLTDLRAAYADDHCLCSEIREEAFIEILGAVCGIRRQLLRESTGPEYLEDLSGG